jgi:hypothetical protein
MSAVRATDMILTSWREGNVEHVPKKATLASARGAALIPRPLSSVCPLPMAAYVLHT